MTKYKHDLVAMAQAVILRGEGKPGPEVSRITGIPARSLSTLVARAKANGWVAGERLLAAHIVGKDGDGDGGADAVDGDGRDKNAGDDDAAAAVRGVGKKRKRAGEEDGARGEDGEAGGGDVQPIVGARIMARYARARAKRIKADQDQIQNQDQDQDKA